MCAVSAHSEHGKTVKEIRMMDEIRDGLEGIHERAEPSNVMDFLHFRGQRSVRHRWASCDTFLAMV